MTPALPFSTRFWLFIYGYPNIAGALFGLIGLLLLFAGVIASGWVYIVAGLYGLGYLLAWQLAPRELHLAIAREVHAENLLAELDSLVDKTRKRLPQEAILRLERLRGTLADLLPRLAEGTGFSHEGHSVERTVRDYLPATLENYLQLPSAFARMHVLRDGKTARDMLLDQLDLLSAQMHSMLASVLSDDARALTENGIFLEQKFKPYDFFQTH